MGHIFPHLTKWGRVILALPPSVFTVSCIHPPTVIWMRWEHVRHYPSSYEYDLVFTNIYSSCFADWKEWSATWYVESVILFSRYNISHFLSSEWPYSRMIPHIQINSMRKKHWSMCTWQNFLEWEMFACTILLLNIVWNSINYSKWSLILTSGRHYQSFKHPPKFFSTIV